MRLYYTDPMLAVFDATVVSCVAEGDRFAVVLDRTAFYPTSGGQPFDTGRLVAGGHGDSARVLEVVDAEDEAGTIRHLADRALPEGTTVRGEIDWPRRFDHMQQHTGQHVLSAAFDRQLGVRTVSFHLGAETSTIDLSREVTAAEVAAAEAGANAVVWDDRPVTMRFVTAEEAASLPLRKDPARLGLLRLVEVAGFDLSACGGTHVLSTGRIGGIFIAGWERFKGASRVTFVCGGRALAGYDALRDQMQQATRALSIGALELGSTVQRLLDEQKAQARTVRGLQEQLAGARADGLAAGAETIGRWRVVLLHEAGADGAALKTLAGAIAARPGLVTILVGDGQPAPVVAARSSDVAFDAGAWIKNAVAALGGRGGGRAETAQGGLAATVDRILTYAREALAR